MPAALRARPRDAALFGLVVRHLAGIAVAVTPPTIAYAVLRSHAHAWAEACIASNTAEDCRFRTFDPTPEDPTAGFVRATSFVPWTAQFNVTGQPAISLPLAENAAGLPIGVQLVAAYGREDLLLRVAAQLEAAQPWADRWPSIA